MNATDRCPSAIRCSTTLAMPSACCCPACASAAEIWDEVLPPTPRELWEDNLARVVRALEAGD